MKLNEEVRLGCRALPTRVACWLYTVSRKSWPSCLGTIIALRYIDTGASLPLSPLDESQERRVVRKEKKPIDGDSFRAVGARPRGYSRG